jgi:N-acetylglucosaminyldiphosphoundecaprenol N-acetyl-beta-D-mannosaminyltransferase
MAGNLPPLNERRVGTENVDLLGARVTASSFEGALRYLEGAVAERRGAFVSNANVYSVMLARDDLAYRKLLAQAGFVLADGMPVVWSLRLLGHPAERVHGDDFMLACCGRQRAWRHFLLGGASGQASRVGAELRRRFPGISIVGVHATPERPVPVAKSEEIANQILAARADLVWVGMGTPVQDEWMAAHAERLGVPLVGVGSAFDVLAGRTRAAPGWMKRSGLQWLFRLAQEPRRLGPRYLYYNPRFIWHAGRFLWSKHRRCA